jgi:hypothetical protein
MTFILLERTSRWAGSFRRAMRKYKSEMPIPICEARSLAQCQRELKASPHSVVGIEILPKNAIEMSRGLIDLSSKFSDSRWIALAARGLEPFELQLREAGAVHVLFSPRSLSPALRLVRRHLSRAPQPRLSLEESIWVRLPWQ